MFDMFDLLLHRAPVVRFVVRSLSSLQKGVKSAEVDEEDLEEMV